MLATVIQSLVAVFGIALLCLFPLTLGYFFILSKMFHILAERHADTYRDLGSPTLILNNTITNGFRFQRFLLTKEYKDLKDPKLTRLGNIGHALTVIGIVVFIGFAVSYVAAAVFIGPQPR